MAFEKDILPILQDRCLTCHSTEKQEGDLDLERFTSLAEVKKQPMIWEGVLEQIQLGEMPPKKEPQLTPAQKSALTQWVQGTLDAVAYANAGDPGPVVLRRLSNMEYTYTIRDLTGVASLDPAREFPVDGAAGEGFTNAGAALVMSPALLNKYLDAAKDIASHAVLTPQGMHFSAGISSRDWTDETLAKIRQIYQRYTESVGTEDLQVAGAKVKVAADGRLPLGRYLEALQGRGSAEGLSPQYLDTLRAALTKPEPSLLMKGLQEKFRAGELTPADIEPWQRFLWRFASVGHIGKANGPKAWQEPVTPIVSSHEMRITLDTGRDTKIYLTTTEAGDGAGGDEVIWENPRLVARGRPDLPIHDLPALIEHLQAERARVIATTEQCLNALAAGKDDADPKLLTAWAQYLGFGTTRLEPLLFKQMHSTPDYRFIQGWQGDQALSVLANSSDNAVRIPGLMKPHSIATHPSPTQASVIAWRSPVTGLLRIQGDIADAHPECGNGVTWALELRRGTTSEVLARGDIRSGEPVSIGPFEDVRISKGQVIAIVINPKDGNHTCDLTAVYLSLSDGKTTWDLAKDVSPNILAGNPHGAWHFLSQPATLEVGPNLPGPIAAWRRAPSPELAAQVREFLEKDLPLNSPLLASALSKRPDHSLKSDVKTQAPSVIEFEVPSALARDAEFVVTGRLASPNGSVQMEARTTAPDTLTELTAGKAVSSQTNGRWTDNNLRTGYSVPFIANGRSEARHRLEAAFHEFRQLFPIALCYSKIVPVDEVVTLTLFHREDDHLKRLMLDEAEGAELDRLWEELRFVSEWPLKQVDVFDQLFQFATQDAKPSAFEPMRIPIKRDAANFRDEVIAAQPRQVQAVLDFASQAWRRPLTSAEEAALRELYQKLRQQELPHAMAVRMLIARVLIAPAFLYRGEHPAPGPKASAVNDWELATRLSYFLWASAPDAELRTSAAAGTLRQSLAAQARRMLKSEKVRRLATEFGCQWLHVRDVATLDEKSARHFPTFIDLRADMQEEVTRFFIDLCQNDRSVLSLLDADYSFVNAPLAGHYGFTADGPDWQRMDGLRQKGRGGILGFAATLAKQSGASRNSAILRGTWISEVVLGDKLPIPPKGVPVLPEEPPQDLTERQLIERHSSDERCASCHRRIDPYGFALEGFDAIGRTRKADTQTTLPDGTQVNGMGDLRDYILNQRRDDFLRQFSRKLLGYALGRSVQLSDKPLIDAMVKSDHRIGSMIELIVQSPQFREVRGRDFGVD